MRKLILLCLAFPYLAFAGPELKGSPDELSLYLLNDKKTITLMGQADERIEADNAVVSLIVKTSDSKLQKAIDKNRNIRSELRKKLEQTGIGAKQITTSKFSSTPNYGWFSDKPKSYDVSNEMKITISKEEELTTIAGLVDDREEVRYSGATIKSTRKTEMRTHARELAMQQVLAKKAFYEKEFGIKLTILNINEHVTDEAVLNQRQQMRFKQSANVESGLASPEPDIADAGGFGELNTSAVITVVFNIK